MNNTILLIGPNFHDFNKYLQKAFQQFGWEVSILTYNNPITPYSTVNKIRYKLSQHKEQLKRISRRTFSGKVKELFDKVEPQIVFILNGGMILPETVQFMSKTSKVVVWLYDSITRQPNSWDILPYCHKVFCYESKDIPLIKNKLSIDAIFLPQAVDPQAYYSLGDVDKEWDIVFAAEMWHSPRRKHLIQTVVNNFPDKKIRVWGIYKPWYKGIWTWLTRERRDIYTNCDATTAQLNQDYNKAKIVLNIHNEQQIVGANPKVYEIAASGSYQICDTNPYIESLFPNGEIGLYHDEKELLEQIKWALDPINEVAREIKAKKAKKIILSSHTFTDRMQTVFKYL